MIEIEAVLFDFGSVLGMFDKRKACAHFAEKSPYDADTIYTIIVGDLEKWLESGRMSDRSFSNLVLERCKIDLTVPDVFRIWGNIFSPNPAIDPIVDVLMQQNVKIGVISNTNGIHWPFIADLPVMRKLRTYGASFTLSYLENAYKPDPALYEIALARIGSRAAETLYLDDIAEYVEAARSLGIVAELYDCTKDPKSINDIMRKYKLVNHEFA